MKGPRQEPGSTGNHCGGSKLGANDPFGGKSGGSFGGGTSSKSSSSPSKMGMPHKGGEQKSSY